MLNVNPTAGVTPHKGQSGGRGMSPRIWSKVNGAAMSPDGASPGYGIGDEFLSFGPSRAVAGNVGYYASEAGLYKTYEDTGNAVAQIPTAVGGVITLTTTGADNQENWMQSCAGAGVLGVISNTAGADKLLLFEARVKISAIAANVGGFFVGLGEEGMAVADTLTDAGAMVSKDFIGFFCSQDDPDCLTFVYRKAGQVMVTKIAALQALVADTYYKVGFVYDPKADAAKRIAVFIDNVEQSTYVTATNIATATFPDAEELAFVAGHKSAGDVSVLTIDWWNFFQAG